VRILLTSGIFPPQIGGPATYLPQLAQDLENDGHCVTIITLGENDEIGFKVSTKVIKIGRGKSLSKRMLKTTIALIRESKKSEAVFSNGLFLETALAITFTRKRLRSVVKIVGDPVWERDRNKGHTSLSFSSYLESKPNLRGRLMRRVYSLAWSTFDFRTAPSLELCNFISAQADKLETIYIPNGVDIGAQSKCDRDVDVVCVSRLVNWKNVDIAIRAAGELNLSMVIIGDGPERNNLEELAQLLHVKADFQGQLTQNIVCDWLNRSKYFLLLSDYEGLSFALLEAMSRGVLPVVSANEGNLSVVSSGRNGIVTKINVDEVVSVLNFLEQNHEIAAALSLAATEHVRIEFNGKDQRAKVIDLLVNGKSK
jgi:glycosyltransferase involved in cell wall biosynthesis